MTATPPSSRPSRGRNRAAPSTVTTPRRAPRAAPPTISWGACTRGTFDRDFCRDSNALREQYRDEEVVPGDETQLVERALLLLTLAGLLRLVDVVAQTWGCVVERAGLAKDVARVDHAEVFLGEAAFVCGVCVDGAEGEARERVSVLGHERCGVAEGGQDLSQCGVFPCKELLLIGRRQCTIFEETESVEAANFYECSNEKRRCLLPRDNGLASWRCCFDVHGWEEKLNAYVMSLFLIIAVTSGSQVLKISLR